jgi:hypothetical protein
MIVNKAALTSSSQKAATDALLNAGASATKPLIKISLTGLPIKTTLLNLGNILNTIVTAQQPSVPLPPQILGTLQTQEGAPGSMLQIEVLPPASTGTAQAKKNSVFGDSTSGSQVLATGLTDANGDFSIPLPGRIMLPPAQSLNMRVRGSSPTTSVMLSAPPTNLGPLGYLGTFPLDQELTPIPPTIFQQLQNEISQSSGQAEGSSSVAPPSLPKLTLGDDADCIRVIENQVSFETYPYGVFFQLLAPTLFVETEQVNQKLQGVYASYNRVDNSTNRAQLAGPISVDDFREGLMTTPKIVGSLGLGYVLRCSQSWLFQGLALGDLVYSLPLAPGESQEVVVEEQTTTLKVMESEQVFGAETSQASAATDASTQAIFNSAFRQAAQGGSSYNTSSETGAMTAGGGLLGILGGPSGSLGETVSSGSTHNWMDGLQNYASNASQSVQTYAEQQSAAQRRASRTSMRMATSSETTSVTTKTIVNHNKLHALTMQYFEVLRLFDVSTAYDGVSLICLVPLDIVWFLPPGQKEHLDDVINDSDVSNGIQYASQINGVASAVSALLGIAIMEVALPFGGSAFAQNTVANVNSQLSAAANTAAALSALLGGLGAQYATQANEANQLRSQISQAQTAMGKFASSKAASDLQSAQSLMGGVANLANAIFQQLSSPSISGGMTRQQVIDRYQGLLAHSDVLKVWLPMQYASGLSRLEKFASDPRASVALDSLAEDIINFSANASVLPFDHVFVRVITRWGTRLGPVEMIPNPPVSIPGQFDTSKAFKTSQDLLQYVQGQRNPGNSSAPTLQASIALPRSLSPQDVVGFEITHTMDSFSYQFATPIDALTGLFGTNAMGWPSGILGGIAEIITTPPVPAMQSFTPSRLASEVGAPYLWNFQASLTASVVGSPETYVQPTSAVELPPGVYPIPAIEVSPVLKYDDLILIENTLQHVLRNMVRYSKAVWTWLTPEERVMLLEPYLVSFPGLPAGNVALLDCIANEVLGFYGNSMMMPFSIPQALGDEQGWPTTTGQLEDMLLRFHRQSAPQVVTRTMLPTRGVLGEAMLGHCASGEKIDLTRFWNWQDSPADAAPAIAPVTVPGSQVPALATAQAPNALSGMLPSLVNNVNAPTVTPTDALAAALAGKAPAASFPDMTGSAQLAQLLGQTQTTANSARQDALNAQTTLTKDAMDQASAVLQAALGGGKASGTPKPGGGGSSSSSSSAASALQSLIPVLLTLAASA